jgi:hypothetical protein
MNMFLGADVRLQGGSLETRFDWNSVERKTKVLVKYPDLLHGRLDTDEPAGPRRRRLQPADVAAAMPAGSMPLYVATVGYGMMAIMCIETDFTEEEMKLALDAAYSAWSTPR